MTALMDAVAAATADVPRLYPLGSVPAKPDYPYASYTALLGRGDAYLLDISEGIRHGRIVVQTFGRTADSAISHAEKVRARLIGTRLVVDGATLGPVIAELDPNASRDPDDAGVIGVTATYAFTKEGR